MSGGGSPALVRVLGPARLPGPDGGLVEPPGALPKRLVVALALAGRDGRSASALVEDLWPDAPPRNARGALQMLVSRTRAVAADAVIVSTASGYRLAESDLAVAEAVAAQRSPARADLDEALGLWRGEPAADVDDPALADDLAARAERARIRLLAARAARLLDEGEPAGALADLDAVGGRQDGPLVLLRMRALAAAGRPGAAVAVFAEHRERLADELGADPDPALVALNAALLREGPDGAELIGVRAAATPLLGRDDDVQRLARDVPAHRLTSIVGPGGLGKTRLAHEVASRLGDRFGRIVFVELAGAAEAADVALVVGAAVGARIPHARRLNDPLPPDLATRTREALAGRRTLLVLDNCEQVIDAAAALTADLLATVPSLAVLTTTRVPLLLPGERIHALQPLDPATDAALLFTERAAAARPGVLLDHDTVERICTHLDGLPLAIELAAARLRSMTLDELDRRLDDRFAVLVGGDRTAPARHRTLFAVIDWSWRLLTDEGRRALRMLAVFPDGFTADGATGLLGRDATGVLADLVDPPLLTFGERRRGTGRYRLLETVREFGLRALADAGETEQAAAALDAVVLAFCRRTAPGLAGGIDPGASTRIAVEEETLLAVLRTPPHGREAVVLAVFALLAEFWIYRGEFERIPDLLPIAIDAGPARPTSDAERDDSLRALTLAAGLGLLTRTPGAVRALALLRRVRGALPPDADGFWPIFSGSLFQQRTGEEAVAELRDLAETSSDPLVATFTALMAGQLLENAGRLPEALAAATQAHRLAERHGLTWFRLVSAMSIAQLHSQRGHREEALRLSLAALEQIEALDVRADLAQLDWIIAVNQVALGRLSDAEHRFGRLAAAPDRSSRETLDNRSIGLSGLAEIAGARGEPAQRTWDDALAAAEGASPPWRVIVRAAALAAASRHPDSSESEGTARSYRRLRGRVLGFARFPLTVVDVPVLSTGVLGLAAVLVAPDRTPAQQAIGGDSSPSLWRSAPASTSPRSSRCRA